MPQVYNTIAVSFPLELRMMDKIVMEAIRQVKYDAYNHRQQENTVSVCNLHNKLAAAISAFYSVGFVTPELQPGINTDNLRKERMLALLTIVMDEAREFGIDIKGRNIEQLQSSLKSKVMGGY